jgi:uncharacterized protein (DUF433 family)
MPFRITYGKGKFSGKTIVRETAVEAWAVVQHLKSGLDVPLIVDASGNEFDWQELRELAIKQADRALGPKGEC